MLLEAEHSSLYNSESLRSRTRMALRKISHSEERAIPIDDDEQVKIITELREKAANHATSTRFWFCNIFRVIAVLLHITLLYSFWFPWSLEHQKHFEGIVPHRLFQAFYVVSIYIAITASEIMKVCYFLSLSRSLSPH